MVTARRSRFFATVVARGRLVGQEDVPMTQPIGSGFCNPPSIPTCRSGTTRKVGEIRTTDAYALDETSSEVGFDVLAGS